MKQIAFTWLLCILSICAYAQQITVTGTVTDAENNPLIGAAVVVVGTTDGVITDFDGKYTIKAASGQSLKFSYVGYQEQTVKVDGRSVINVKLSEGEFVGRGGGYRLRYSEEKPFDRCGRFCFR